MEKKEHRREEVEDGKGWRMGKGGERWGDKEMFVYKELMCSVQLSFTTAVCSHGL